MAQPHSAEQGRQPRLSCYLFLFVLVAADNCVDQSSALRASERRSCELEPGEGAWESEEKL